jgi:nucleoside-diphosphate-sugar epimerase
MNTDRRNFLQLSLAAGAIAATGARAAARTAQGPSEKPKEKKKLLILGGTGFLGPAIVRCAQERGHELTLFNRGKTRPGLFPDVEQLRGNRYPEKDEGLKALEGRAWDAVFDDCGYVPRVVKASGELLAPSVKHYVYISSISAYADNSREGCDESATLATMADPTVEDMGKDYANYGPLKALCEQAAEKAMPGRATIVRPGYIVGPEDPSDRFTYWPVRVARGGEVLAPGEPGDPIQIIDVRDLAAWLVLLVERGTFGVFNACGPEKRLTMGATLEACKAARPGEVRFTWVPVEFLEEHQVGELPIWAPYRGDSKGSHTWSNARAVKAGLTFRPVGETVKDTLAWYETLPEERRSEPRAGLEPERERELLAAFHAAQAK